MRKLWPFVVVLVIVGAGSWIWIAANRGTEFTSAYKSVESAAASFHQSEGEWPESYEDAERFATPEEARLVEQTFRDGRITVTFHPMEDSLRVVYSGPGFDIERFVWERFGRYEQGTARP